MGLLFRRLRSVLIVAVITQPNDCSSLYFGADSFTAKPLRFCWYATLSGYSREELGVFGIVLLREVRKRKRTNLA